MSRHRRAACRQITPPDPKYSTLHETGAGPIERQLESLYSPDDLILYFVSYPGTHYLGFFNVPRLRTLAIDKVIMQSNDPDQAFARIRDAVLATQNAGGKVIVFDALDPYDWNGAWATFAGMGIAKARVTDFLASNFKIEYLGRVAEMPAWRIDKP